MRIEVPRRLRNTNRLPEKASAASFSSHSWCASSRRVGSFPLGHHINFPFESRRGLGFRVAGGQQELRPQSELKKIKQNPYVLIFFLSCCGYGENVALPRPGDW